MYSNLLSAFSHSSLFFLLTSAVGLLRDGVMVVGGGGGGEVTNVGEGWGWGEGGWALSLC